VLGQAIKFSGAESAIVRPPPEMGEHSREILAALGFGEGEIDALAASGVI
jgi:crotonobetainyl-CoA:carnitine CoA-transferase CaiB-like acyl-CoA transferase